MSPFLVTGTADAASDRTWNRLAGCESSRRWHISTGNGYHGGLQFSLSTWRGYGGGQFARYPHRARRVEQVIIGQRVMRGQGWGAWPACSNRLNLDRRDKRGVPRSVKRYRANHRVVISDHGDARSPSPAVLPRAGIF
ncbi:MAG TPA: transglycosylase family protein [Nocardioidaceae bacterium]|nr:transglycosylase family protein [Nocardioidaceae bacterium]